MRGHRVDGDPAGFRAGGRGTRAGISSLVILERLSLGDAVRRSSIRSAEGSILCLLTKSCAGSPVFAYARLRMTKCYAENFRSLMASKSWTPPPTRFVV